MSIGDDPVDALTHPHLMATPDAAEPLVLDLDGTLIATDLLVESLLQYLKARPWNILLVVAWLMKGRAHLKRRLAEATALDVELLPIREDVVAYARAQAGSGRPVYIATAANAALAARLASRFDFLTGVIGSDDAVNLKGANKAAALVARFPQGFTYVGDAAADLPVWAAASHGVFAGASPAILRRLERLKPPIAVLSPPRAGVRDWFKALRLHQWAKNVLIFVPLVLGGAMRSPTAWSDCALGFASMGCLASGTYLINDLIDLQDDRRHWSKRHRAFASGRLSIALGLGLIPIALALGLWLGWMAGAADSLSMIVAYLVVTLSYSFGFKRVPILDVVILAALFTLRLAIGVVCSGVVWSPWLLVFSMFVFASLSSAKRYTEIARLKAQGGDRLAGRGYLVVDEPLVLALGVSLAAAAVFVMVMYLIEEAFRAEFYRQPGFLWSFPVVLALWLGRIWLLCGRGQLNDDPVIFAIRDRVSLALGAVLALAAAAAVLG